MREHIKICFHPHCRIVDEIVILYNLFKGSKAQKQDPITLILYENVEGLPRLETDCLQGSQLNSRMRETHKIMTTM